MRSRIYKSVRQPDGDPEAHLVGGVHIAPLGKVDQVERHAARVAARVGHVGLRDAAGSVQRVGELVGRVVGLRLYWCCLNQSTARRASVLSRVVADADAALLPEWFPAALHITAFNNPVGSR